MMNFPFENALTLSSSKSSGLVINKPLLCSVSSHGFCGYSENDKEYLIQMYEKTMPMKAIFKTSN